MKRSEMVEHIAADIEEMLTNLENRPKTRPHIAETTANNILDMLEGFGMLPPTSMSWVQNGDQVSYESATVWEPEE